MNFEDNFQLNKKQWTEVVSLPSKQRIEVVRLPSKQKLKRLILKPYQDFSTDLSRTKLEF